LHTFIPPLLLWGIIISEHLSASSRRGLWCHHWTPICT
jgi:hypothetical protein